MKKWTTNKIRESWLNFWISKGHLELPSKSLIPVNDPSLLWINSGVATLKPFFSGQVVPPNKRLTNCQKAIRTNDITNVGVTSRHHTFFEMLGNFSIGEYFKTQAIEWAYELLTKVFGFDLDKLFFTVFKDDKDAYDCWISLGVKSKHIIKCDKDRNFWDVGQGPCGPCTEIFYDRGEKYDPKKIGIDLFYDDIENDRYVEIWNIVFSQFNNDGNNNYTDLVQKNIDTGAGLERLACVLQDVPTNFDTDSFLHIIKSIEKLTDAKYDSENYFKLTKEKTLVNHSYRIIADHIKACCFAIADGAIPSNKERGYILRKLIRRSMIFAHKIKIQSSFMEIVAKSVIESMEQYYPYLSENREKIINCLLYEENLFNKTLVTGFEIFKKEIKNKTLDAETTFKLFDTYGFPLELTIELAKEQDIRVDVDGFNTKLKQHQEISRQQNVAKAMAKQNSDLILFTNESFFDYENSKIAGKVIGIFDENFKKIDAVSFTGKYWLVFDKTCLYANSGGQIADHGTIEIKEEDYECLDVIKGPNHQHFHLIEIDPLQVISIGDSVITCLNKNDRRIICAHHTCEHLLQKALTTLIDKNLKQEGAFKSFEKFTFDFLYHEKLNQTQLDNIEDLINSWIKKTATVKTHLLTLDEAKKIGAIAYFEDVYSKIKTKLRVVKIEDISCEICGGTHVKNLSDIEEFHISKLTSKGSGAWRIEAFATHENTKKFLKVKNESILNTLNNIKSEIKNLDIKDADFIKLVSSIKLTNDWQESKKNDLILNKINEQWFVLTKEARESLEKKQTNAELSKVLKQVDVKPYQFVSLTNVSPNIFNNVATEMANRHQDKLFIVINVVNDRINYIVTKSDKSSCKDAGEIIRSINAKLEGRGCGKALWAQGSAKFNGTETYNKLAEVTRNLIN